MLSLNYDKRLQNWCFSANYPIRAAYLNFLKKFGFSYIFSAQIEMVPQNYQKLESEEHIKLMEKLIDIMEEDDDVQNVWHNWEE